MRDVPDDFLDSVLGPPAERMLRAERLHEQRRASLTAAGREEPDRLHLEMFRVMVFDQARHRRALMSLAQHCWARAETGPVGWLGDVFDELEYRSRRWRARRNMGRKTISSGQ